MTRASLPVACRYFPLAHGKYEVAAGLRALGSESGNGATDAKVFQFDAEYPRYREGKLAARAEWLEKYHPQSVGLDDASSAEINRFIIESLARDWPEYFQLVEGRALECALSSERIVFDEGYRLISATQATPPYRDLFDALASQLQEDLAIWRRDPDGDPQGWLAAIHLCFPNHWAAEEKIGKPFNAVHQPVAGFGKLAKAAPSLVGMMVEKGPFVRFAWGIGTDRDLNHHPGNEFQGRAFSTTVPVLELRIERQTLTSFPEAGASLFTIRTYFLDVAKEISGEEREALVSAIDSMTAESLAYKGLDGSKEAIKAWLGSLR
ncbi:heme-dependent oxidative N-demethylase family protein [Luteolibacter soli]|uniref:DUF3445 domain-containing protein n=1 Tax=Luteolibacter soli TaxID=3135280 RepID=A0ABU9ANM2_9BACT